MSKQRVLVIGGSGFIGRAIVQRLGASDAFEPVIASRHGASGLRLDATDAVQLVAAFKNCDAVVNCVAGSAAVIRANGAALAQATADARNPELHVVHLSSMAVYGSASGTVREDAPLSGDLGDYSAAKAAAETALRTVGDHTTVLRPGIVYGPGSSQWTLRIARLLRQRRLGDLGAVGDGCCNLVHVDDVALSVERVLTIPAARRQVFNLAMANSPSWNEYLVRFALALRAVPVRRVGGRRLKIETKLLAPPLKIFEILATRLGASAPGIAPPIPGSLVRTFAQDIRLDVHRAGEVLGIAWRDLDAELRSIALELAGKLERK